MNSVERGELTLAFLLSISSRFKLQCYEDEPGAIAYVVKQEPSIDPDDVQIFVGALGFPCPGVDEEIQARISRRLLEFELLSIVQVDEKRLNAIVDHACVDIGNGYMSLVELICFFVSNRLRDGVIADQEKRRPSQAAAEAAGDTAD